MPAGSTVANGDTSDASDLNTPLQDIEADLNTPRPVVAGGTGASSASSARTNLAVPGLADNATITGTWTFDQATGADTGIVTGTAGADGDVATWNADGDVVGGTRIGMEFIEKLTASNSATLTFTGFDAGKYDSYMFVFQNLRSTSDGDEFDMRTDADGGASFDNGATDYNWGVTVLSHVSTTVAGDSDNGDTRILIAPALLGNASGEDFSGHMMLYEPGTATRRTRCTWSLDIMDNAGQGAVVHGSGARRAEAVVNAVRFRFVTGNINSGSIIMYGLRNS